MVSISYCMIVIWYVATFPDIGIRCLLPTSAETHELQVTQFVHSEEDCKSEPVRADQGLVRIGGAPAGNFLLFVHNLARLRSAQIPPGGQLPAGSDPSEQDNPPLVEIAAPLESSDATRMVELILKQPKHKDPQQTTIRTYVAIKPMEPWGFLLTIFWFLCQLMILGVAMTAFWQRPADRVVRIFCLMCCASMPAFVGGFHWWVLAASPLLNLPFIFAACLLPAVTLHFFSSFPRESYLLQTRRNLMAWLIYVPPTVCAVVVAFTYWTAYALNGAATGQEELSVFQKLVAVVGSLAQNRTPTFDSVTVCAQLLYVLRIFVFTAITLSCVYFGMTVISLAASLVRTQNPVERRQASGILMASVVATIPIMYTLYLALFRRAEFALGQAQFPMFVASGLFMAAYAHGMMKHRLILANEILMRGRQYLLVSGMVTCLCAVVLAIGAAAAATRVYALPNDSSILLKLSLFLIIVVAIAFVLWARDRFLAIVDQRFFSDKYQLDKTLKQLNQASGYLTDPTALAEITLATCRDVMDASSAAMFVRESSGILRLIGAARASTAPASLPPELLKEAETSEIVVRRSSSRSTNNESCVQKLLHDMSAELVCFLRGDQGVDGLILLSKRSNGVAYSPEDSTFLQAIGQMSVLALHSSRANQNLAQLNSELKVKVDRIAEQQRQLIILRAELTSLQEVAGEGAAETPDAGLDRGEIRGKSAAIMSVLETVRKAAASTATVLIRGESGTGKELLARVVHRNSERADKPLVTVNCAALAPSLLESELFGHVRGAFTGASSDKEGRFQAADGGTLFLDEIGDISLETQVKLLRVLQERCFEPVGTNKTVKVDVRLITATHRDLEAMISAGEFREDLYYRLNVVSVTLPPLRARREDLIELVFFFLNRTIQRTDKRIRQIEPEALAVIEQHRWPGNIRELENVIERAVVLADGDTITLKDLPAEICRTSTPTASDSSVPTLNHWPTYQDADNGSEAQGAGLSHGSSRNLAAEKQRMVAALQAAAGNKAQAARAMKMPRSTFYSKLKKFGLAD